MAHSSLYRKHLFTYKLIAATTLLIFLVLFLLSYPKTGKLTRNRQPATGNQFLVPEPNTTSADKNTAVPQSVTQSALGTDSKLRTFSISAKDSSLSQNRIIVYVGDIVHIQFSAHDDGKYDFSIPDLGLSQEANKGETRIVEFQAVSPGSFPIICSKCKSEGTLVVVPRT